MQILERYLLGEVVKTFLLAIGIFAVVFLLASLYELLHKGFPPSLVLTLLPFATAYTAPYLVAVALAIGCSLAYGRLAQDNEVLPILAGGIHPRVLVGPGLLVGAALTLLMIGFQATIVPYCYAQKNSVLKEVLENLAHLPKAENKVISHPRGGFFFFAERTDGSDVEGVQFTFFGGVGLSGREAADGRIELEARRGRIEKSASGAIAIEVFGARVRYLEPWSLHLSVWDQDAGGRGDRRGAQAAGSPGALDPAEWALLRAQIPAAGRFDAADRDADGLVSKSELEAHAKGIDKTELPIRTVETVELQRAAFEIAESKTSYRLKSRSNRSLEALLGRFDRARGLAASDPLTRGALEVSLLAPGLLGVGAAPLFPGVTATAADVDPGPRAQRDSQVTRRRAAAVLHERWTLALAPLLFALVASVVPLLLNSDNRLLPFFVSFATVATTFFGPYILGKKLVDKGRGIEPWLGFWPGVALTALVGIALFWRLTRR